MSAAVPIYKIDSQEVEDTWQALAMIQRAIQADPKLGRNKYVGALKDTAYARFLLNFEAME